MFLLALCFCSDVYFLDGRYVAYMCSGAKCICGLPLTFLFPLANRISAITSCTSPHELYEEISFLELSHNNLHVKIRVFKLYSPVQIMNISNQILSNTKRIKRFTVLRNLET